MSNASSPATPERGRVGRWIDRLWAVPPCRGYAWVVVLLPLVGVMSFLFDERSIGLGDRARATGDKTVAPCDGWTFALRVTAPDVKWALYDTGCLHKWAQRVGPSGRAYYIRSQLYLDVAFPVIYGLLLATALAVSHGCARAKHSPGGPPHAGRRWLLLPALAVAFDLAENATLIYLVTDFPNNWREGLAVTVRWFTFLKFAFILLSAIAIVVAAAVSLFPRRGKKS